METASILPQDVPPLDRAFPASVGHLLPAWEAIPEEFKGGCPTKWNRLFSDWFYVGLRSATFTPKDGIDEDTALIHIGTVMNSFEPKQEHKEAGVAYLLSLWFDDAEWTAVR